MILGIYGYHDSGKTRYLEKLIRMLEKKGITAAAVKHLGRHYRPDPKKDTTRLASAGFDPVAAVADGELVLRLAGHDDLWSAVSAIELLSSPDVIFVEGFKNEPIEKIAVGTIEELPGTIFRATDISETIQFIVRRVEKERASLPCGCKIREVKALKGVSRKRGERVTDVELKLVVNGKKIAANDFVKNMMWETLSGMMRSLKGVEGEIESIEISAKKV